MGREAMAALLSSVALIARRRRDVIRHVARVEPVGRGETTGGGVALRPPFTPRRSTQRARNETARGEAAEGGTGVGWGPDGARARAARRRRRRPQQDIVPYTNLALISQTACKRPSPSLGACLERRTYFTTSKKGRLAL